MFVFSIHNKMCTPTLQHAPTSSWVCAHQLSMFTPTLQHVHVSRWACACFQVPPKWMTSRMRENLLQIALHNHTQRTLNYRMLQ